MKKATFGWSLGNEGVLVQQGQTKILFNAFYLNGYNNYALVDEATSKALMAGEAPYVEP